MRILVDVDGVLADVHTPWLERYNRDYGDSLTVPMITRWELTEIVDPECGEKIFDYLQDPTLYTDAPVIPGAEHGIQRLRTAGREIVFVTAGIYPAKAKWLVDHGFSEGPWFNPRDVVVARSKALIKGDRLIDDYIGNLTGTRNGILLTQPWNANADVDHELVMGGHFRAANWDEIEDMLV